MSYNPLIPQATDIISQSQAQILANFTAIDSNTIGFGVDHVQFSAVTDQGKHNKSTYLEQGVDPNTALNELAVYSKASSGISELFMRKENNGTVVQLTQNSTNAVSAASTGSTFLPGGVILKWGQTTANGATVITFAGLGLANFPNNCWQVLATCINAGLPTVANDYVYVHTFTASQFQATGVRRITLQSTPVTFSFIAIGN